MWAAVFAAVLLSACSSTKSVPDNAFLLEKVTLKSDTRHFDASVLQPYLKQKTNSKWFSALNIPLHTYSLAGRDTTKWINKTLKKIGEQPVLFDSVQAQQACHDLTAVMRDMGYLDAKTLLAVEKNGGKKVRLHYTAIPGQPYFIGSLSYNILDDSLRTIIVDNVKREGSLKRGLLCSVSALDAERKRLTAYLLNNGYYRFNKDFITFTADTTNRFKFVDVTMNVSKFKASDNAPAKSHPLYTIGKVSFIPAEGNVIGVRESVLRENTLLREGRVFCQDDLQATYSKFGRLAAIKYTGIKFSEVPDSNILNCDIRLSTNKVNSISFQPEGTNTSGDLGAAASLTYENRNIFKGSEVFSVKLRGAFEAITGLEGYQNQNYEEYSIEGKLSFPRFMAPFISDNYRRRSQAVSELAVSYDMQNRPEFHRRVFSAAWRYRWSNARRGVNCKVDVLDLNYIYMPWISPKFKHDYLDSVSNRNAILRYNYEDLFVMKAGFSMAYTGKKEALKLNVETAGNLLGVVSGITNTSKNSDGQYTLFNIAFAQYVKGDIDYTRLWQIDKNNQMAFHVGFGIAYPYGNSKVLPFEKRYFSGGANSVRGWSVRGLGPGSFKGKDGAIDFINQTGDMKLDMNVEFRTFLFWKLYGAVFVDAGNIWTLRYYDEQPGGQFDIKEFYKQIAVAYGMGIRLNFDYFVLRFDMGMKAVNPAYTTHREHYPILNHDLSRDFAFHFAVGLPF